MTVLDTPRPEEATQDASAGAPTQHRPGTTRIAPKALERLVRAISADALGVDASAVSVNLGDVDGKLDIEIAGPVAVDARREPSSTPTILDAVAHSQRRISDTTTALSGSSVGRVSIRITSFTFVNDRRVA